MEMEIPKVQTLIATTKTTIKNDNRKNDNNRDNNRDNSRNGDDNMPEPTYIGGYQGVISSMPPPGM